MARRYIAARDHMFNQLATRLDREGGYIPDHAILYAPQTERALIVKAYADLSAMDTPRHPNAGKVRRPVRSHLSDPFGLRRGV